MRRWSALSSVEKFDVYTRWSLYAIAGALPVFLATWLDQQTAGTTTLRWAFWGAALAFTAICVYRVLTELRRLSVDQSDRPPLGVSAILTVLVAAAVVIALALQTWPPPSIDERGQWWVMITVLAYTVATTTMTASWRTIWLVAAVAGGSMALYSRFSGDLLWISSLIGTVALIAAAVGAWRGSVLMLDLMYRIDDARHVESRLAVAEERLRFARDLHDTLGRNLSAIALKSQVAQALVLRDADAANGELDAVRDLADDSLSQMRAVVRGYRALDLATEISGARSLLQSVGIRCTISAPEDPGACGRDELAWAVREAVTNVIRHSKATRCTIEVTERSVRVWNDGAPAADGAGSGLHGLRDRLAAQGGSLTVRRPRKGEFELIATLDADGLAPEGI